MKTANSIAHTKVGKWDQVVFIIFGLRLGNKARKEVQS